MILRVRVPKGRLSTVAASGVASRRLRSARAFSPGEDRPRALRRAAASPSAAARSPGQPDDHLTGAVVTWPTFQGLGDLGAPGLRPVGGHRLDDPLEVVQRGELDHYLALAVAELNLDSSLECVRELVGYVLQSGSHRLRPGVLLPGCLRGLGAEGDDLFHGPHR